jgi:outer membrane murein-binding lipoprotein Lpp
MKKINFKSAIVAVLGVGLLAGCASSAHIEKDETVNFSKYKSFTWLHGENGKLENQSDLVESKIRAAVTKEFEKIGWRESKNRPDVILDYDVLVERSSKNEKEPVYSQPYSRLVYNPYTRRYATIYYPSQFLGYESYEKVIKEGTITVTMIDAKTDKTVWQGWTTGEVNNRNLTNKEIQKAVAGIFKKSELAKQ